MGLHKENWDRNKLSPDFAGAMCCSPPQTTIAVDHRCSTPTRGRLCQIGASLVAKQVERHHFLLANRCAILTFFLTFRLFRFWTSRRAIHQHRLIPLTYRHMSSLNMAHPMHRSMFSPGISYIVVATSLLPGFGPSENGSLAKARNLGASKIGWDAGNGRSDWSDRYAGWMDGCRN